MYNDSDNPPTHRPKKESGSSHLRASRHGWCIVSSGSGSSHVGRPLTDLEIAAPSGGEQALLGARSAAHKAGKAGQQRIGMPEIVAKTQPKWR